MWHLRSEVRDPPTVPFYSSRKYLNSQCEVHRVCSHKRTGRGVRRTRPERWTAQSATGTTSSNSTGRPSGMLTTPRTTRPESMSDPEDLGEDVGGTVRDLRMVAEITYRRNAEPSFATALTLSNDPRCARIAATALRAAISTVFRPSSADSSAPTRPMTCGSWPTTDTIALRQGRLPIFTLSRNCQRALAPEVA